MRILLASLLLVLTGIAGFAAASAQTYRVVGVASNDILNARAGPGTRYPVVFRIAPTARGISLRSTAPVTVGNDIWVEISVRGRTGWVNRHFLAAEQSPSRPAQVAGPTYRVTGVAPGDVLNMRAGPGTQYRVVGRLSPGARGITTHGAPRAVGSGFWVQIDFRGVSGWVNQRFLEQERPQPTKAAPAPQQAASTQPKKLKPFALPKGTAGDVEAGKRVALVIGNGAYNQANGVPRLPNASNDGRDVAAELKQYGFDVIDLIDADLKRMQKGLASFRKQARDARIALFYFAGHGMQISGENYLLPVSATVSQHEDLLQGSLSLSEVMGALIRATPELSLVILDACRNNPLTSTLAENARSRGLKRIEIKPGLARRKGAPGMLIAYSTDPDNVASDGKERNSPFTGALLRNMRQPELEIRLMFGEVRSEVVEATSGKQTPWVEEAVLGRFYFRPPPKIRKDRFYGAWDHEHYTLTIDANRVKLAKAAYIGEPPRHLEPNSKECGNLFEQDYSIVPVDKIPATFTDPEIEDWAKKSSRGKSLLVMSVTCGFGSHRFYLLLTEYQTLLFVEFGEQDFLMKEEFYRPPQ